MKLKPDGKALAHVQEKTFKLFSIQLIVIQE